MQEIHRESLLIKQKDMDEAGEVVAPLGQRIPSHQSFDSATCVYSSVWTLLVKS